MLEQLLPDVDGKPIYQLELARLLLCPNVHIERAKSGVTFGFVRKFEYERNRSNHSRKR